MDTIRWKIVLIVWMKKKRIVSTLKDGVDVIRVLFAIAGLL